MLVCLISVAILRSPPGSDIEFEIHAGQDYCTLAIEHALPRSLTGTERKKLIREFHEPGYLSKIGPPAHCLSLARRFAACLNLRLLPSIVGDARFRIRVSGFKLV